MHFLIQRGYSALCESDNMVFILLNVCPFLNLCDCMKGLSNSLLSIIAACVYVFYIVYCQLRDTF